MEVAIHLRQFNLTHAASFEDVKTAYKRLVLQYHPDRFMHDERLRRRAEQALCRINLAYEALEQFYNARRQTGISQYRSVARRIKRRSWVDGKSVFFARPTGHNLSDEQERAEQNLRPGSIFGSDSRSVKQHIQFSRFSALHSLVAFQAVAMLVLLELVRQYPV